jgi:quinohemoprotein ethanol dehydrogenase
VGHHNQPHEKGIAMILRFVALSALMALVLASGCTVKNNADDQLLKAVAGENWLTHGGTYAEQRFSTLEKINSGNVGSLGLAWSMELDTNRGQETTPLVVDGVVYLTTAWSKVVALEGATGKKLWQYDPAVPGQAAVKACCDVVNRGAAYYDGKIFVGSLDGRLIALDARSGKPAWTVSTVDMTKPYTITGAPRVVKGNIIIGNGGADLGVRGYVSAYNAQSGKLVWRFYTVPRPDGKADGAVSDDVLKAKAETTWSDGVWKETGGGGTVWDAIVYDVEFDQILIGVGNGSPWNHKIRSGGKGDNLFLSSVLALDATTGKYKWHYQQTPGETWDFTATQNIILATLPVQGTLRKVLMQAPKNGFFYVIDRANGKLISAEKFAKATWASRINLASGRPVEDEAARYRDAPALVSPSAFGAHGWFPMSFSPKTGLVYLPVQEIPMVYEQEADYRTRQGTFNTGSYSKLNLLPDDPVKFAAIRASVEGWLVAWDPLTQKAVWKVKQAGPSSAGTLATAGNLVFEGTMQGQFNSYDARTGKRLWSFQAQDAVIGSPISFSLKGEQYVLVVAGSGGGFAVSSPFVDDKRAKPNGRVLAFKLEGQASLPAFKPEPLAAATAGLETFTAIQVAKGERIYESTCSWCHGAGTLAGGVLPDLRRSAVLTDAEQWKSIVIDGALAERGMVSFSRSMDAADAEAVRAYVSQKSRILATTEGKR